LNPDRPARISCLPLPPAPAGGEGLAWRKRGTLHRKVVCACLAAGSEGAYMSSRRNIGARLAGVFVGVAPLVFGSAVPALAVTPTIASFTPTGGPVGCMVTITGAGFTAPDVTKVTFGASTGTPVDQTTVIVDAATQVRAAVPTGAVSGTLTVTNPVAPRRKARVPSRSAEAAQVRPSHRSPRHRVS
jgi:hypothetical protein